jgi:hypothetical protein
MEVSGKGGNEVERKKQVEGGRWVGERQGSRQVGGVDRSCQKTMWGQEWPKKNKIKREAQERKQRAREKKSMRKKRPRRK